MKETFAAKTFASKVFASGAWVGVGTAPVPTTDIDGNFADELRPFVDDDFMETARMRAEEHY